MADTLQPPVSDDTLVSVEGLTKVFLHGGRRLTVLDSIDLRLSRGEMLSVVGRSGAGKSTLLHILGTLDRPTGGTLRILGRDVRAMGPSEVAAFRNRTIGFVFQFHHLLPEFTALENAMMPALIARLPRDEAAGRAAELLAAVGLTDRLTHRPGELSGGEQQRVALARALVLHPPLVLADEPTGNLDSRTADAIHGLLIELNQRYGSAILVVTHNADLAARMPRRLRMVDGRVVEDERDASAGGAP